jgi:hypothetical protein
MPARFSNRQCTDPESVPETLPFVAKVYVLNNRPEHVIVGVY